MGYARVRHTWTDGAITLMEVGSGDNACHPDLMDMLEVRVVAMHREIVGESVDVDEEED